ncbi:MAG TPA: hypothetical protein VEB86_04155 [Chryseosolibacter sp.]|nr:hypothetical protein [Chryseosolibacter sp.]
MACTARVKAKRCASFALGTVASRFFTAGKLSMVVTIHASILDAWIAAEVQEVN